MKLCIVTPCVVKGDGQGRANYEIVQEALRCGHKVTLLTSRLDPTIQQHTHVTWIEISTKKFPGQLLHDLVFSFKSTAWLQAHHAEFDLIQVYGAVTHHLGDVNTAVFIHSAWRRSPAHIAKTRRDFYGFYHWLYTSLNAFWEKRAFQQAKLVIAVSELVKKELMDIGVSEDKLQVVLNGVDIEEFTPDSASRKELGLPENVPIAVFAGDIRLNRKNLDTVLHALAEIPNLHLAVVGALEGSPYPKLAAQLNLESRVHFLGYRQDMARIMQAADLFVFPSRYEPFGMVVLEAMASGIPVVTAATTGAAEVVTPECGVVVSDPDDVKALASALRQLADDPEKCRSMGKSARKVAEQYSWQKQAKAYIDHFESIVATQS